MTQPTRTHKVIGVAVVRDGNNYLVGIRGREGPLAGFAEFPGGKVHPGESPANCAVRECEEETGLVVNAVRELVVHRQAYDYGSVELHFWECTLRDDQTPAVDHRGFVWVAASELSRYPFPDGNRTVLPLLREATGT